MTRPDWRRAHVRAIALACCACACSGDGGPISAAPTTPAADAPRANPVAVVASRDAPIPEAAVPGERLLFVRAGSIWMARPDGEDAEQLTVRAVEAPDADPALSPDGTTVAYASARDGTSRVYVQTLSDMIPEALTDGTGGGDHQPAWSPDGRQLAFMRGDPRMARDLHVVDAGGGTPRLLLAGDDEHPEHAGNPTWTPDGSAIILSADRREGRGSGLYRLDLTSGALTRITPSRAGGWWLRDLDPAVSPDGGRIVLASNRHGASGDDAEDTDLYSITPDGSGLTRLTDDPGRARHPTYSPDGKRIFFASTRIRTAEFEWEIYVMPAGGGQQRRITRDAQPQNSAPHAGVARTPPQ